MDIHCKSRASNRELLVVDLHPAHNQVVFEGDPFKIECGAPSIIDAYDPIESRDTHLEWTWLDSNPQDHFKNINIENRFLPENGIIRSSLTINRLERNHTGIWNCLLISSQGNYTKGITVVVISDETEYCPIEVTSNNKGTYSWPHTIVNFTVTTSCESIQLNSEVAHQKASYFCSPEGQWENLNTSACPYVSSTTKILEQFSKVNLTFTKENILESAKHFKNQTSNLAALKDVMDLVFVVRTIQNYLEYLDFDKELVGILMDILNGVMNMARSFIADADIVDGSCGKMVKAVEVLSGHAPLTTLHKVIFLFKAYFVSKKTAIGI